MVLPCVSSRAQDEPVPRGVFYRRELIEGGHDLLLCLFICSAKVSSKIRANSQGKTVF
jgi:hypothetical protein